MRGLTYIWSLALFCFCIIFSCGEADNKPFAASSSVKQAENSDDTEPSDNPNITEDPGPDDDEPDDNDRDKPGLTPPDDPDIVEPIPGPTEPEIESIEMNLTCLEQDDTNPSTMNLMEKPIEKLNGTNDEISLNSWEGEKTVPLIVKGDICSPKDIKRNVLIVVDVSGSMNKNDPAFAGSCGRLRAVESLIKSSGPERSYAIVTFSDSVVQSSTSFLSTPGELFADVAPGMSPAGVLCAAYTNTFYDVALDRAGVLFEEADDADFSELYFISDGEPTENHEGFSLATKLKSEGITIGGIMLAGQDQALKSNIVSNGPDGKPLFFQVAQANNLAKTLADLAAAAESRVLEAGFKLKGLSSDFEVDIDALERTKEGKFELDPIQLNRSLDDTGFDLHYSYRLSNGQEVTFQSQILWNQ